MGDYNQATYGQRIAPIYDDLYTAVDPAAIETLTVLAHGGHALELGIGTGRIALPLHERGIDIHGIDASQAMVARLQAKPGGETIPVTMGDFRDVPVDGTFRLIFVVFNTFFALLTQDDQVQCFANVARHLEPEGAFVIEAFVPDLGRFDRRQTVRVIGIDNDRVRMEVSMLDFQHQRINSRHVMISPNGIQVYPVQIRYAWPSELDLMARLAGLTLKNRWSGWNREPFTSDSGRHISVYGWPGSGVAT